MSKKDLKEEAKEIRRRFKSVQALRRQHRETVMKMMHQSNDDVSELADILMETDDVNMEADDA